MTASAAHVKISNQADGSYKMFCDNCGGKTWIQPPMSIDMALVMMKQFGKEHKACPKPEPQTEEVKCCEY